MSIAMSILGFLLTIGVLVAFHEFGHFWMARRLGVKVLTYSLGFGKALWSTKRGPDQTEYRIAMLPLGGYVKMLDEREGPVIASEQHRAFNRQPVWKRFLIVLAGPVANIILALVLWMAMFMVGVQGVLPKVGVLPPDSILAKSGLQDGDVVTQVGGSTIHTLSDLRLAVLEGGVANARVPIQYEHQGAISMGTLDLTQLKPLSGSTDGRPRDVLKEIGYRLWSPAGQAIIHKVLPGTPAAEAGLKSGDVIRSVDGHPYRDPANLIRIIGRSAGQSLTFQIDRAGNVQAMTAVERSWTMTALTFQVFGGLISGQASLSNLSGPVAIAEYAGQSLLLGFSTFLGFLALVSLSLAIMNLLPVPLLDGGHLVMYLAEAIRGKAVGAQFEAMATRVGLFFLVSLMIVAFYNDIARLMHS
jgi:regulator of sigma E protease